MDSKKFKLWNRICAALAFVVSAVTYLLTIEPSASFWDCGEFIASSYKLEVGHPPGNPVFQLFARFATLFGDNMHAAILVNALSALCSAATIFFLYLTIVWLAKRLVRPAADGSYSLAQAIAIFGAGLTGALVYTFSDTFWFSAVEAEVYAMSSLFTAIVFWLMTVWYDRADEPHALRWIVLIAFLMGLSIGVHLLNLLAIPALVFMFFYRKRESGRFTFWELVKILALSVVIIGLLVFLFIPYLPKLAAYFDLFFVNVLGLPYNTGAAFFLVALLALLFWGLFRSLKKDKVFLNTVLLCTTTIVVGFSVFSIDIIRSCAKTPTNEYQPDNAFTLVRYLSREQYGSNPLIYGEYYGAPYELETTTYYAPVNGKYKKVEGPVRPRYDAAGKMLFPRMWSTSGDGSYEAFYETYTDGNGTVVPGSKIRKPTMGDNLYYFFDYQLNWMYWRYFMWNFAGRQNQVHSPTPGDLFHGNWESGVKFIDDFRLGDQTDAPGVLAGDKGKNHYYFLPLLLGLLGLFFQFDRDKRGSWLTFLMFFMTGIAIVLYLNQPPYQVRERDYAYAGSFYFFSAWVGLGVLALFSWIDKARKGRGGVLTAGAVSAVCLLVPLQMAGQNWDDHDRSNRRTAVELARNYLNSVGPNGILVTHGDNDTFPLWYAQEVEGVRTDVRICNTSLLGTDWHIDQMKWAVNESAPLPITIGPDQYLYGTNEMVPIVDTQEREMDIADVLAIIKHPQIKVPLSSGRKADYLPTRKIVLPVNRENVIKYGILDEKYADQIPDSIVLTISKDKSYLTKPELFLLDLLAGYQWDRPLHFLNLGGDLNVGIKEYLEYTGYSFKFIPIKNKTTNVQAGFVDKDELYRMMTEVYSWDALARDDYFVDYQNMYTNLGVMSVRNLFLNCANIFADAGQDDRALEMVEKCFEVTAPYPLETVPLGFSDNDQIVILMIEHYYQLGKPEQARQLATRLGSDLLASARFYLEFFSLSHREFEAVRVYISNLAFVLKEGGDEELSDQLLDNFLALVEAARSAMDES